MAALSYTSAALPPHVKHHTVPLPQADVAVFISRPASPPPPTARRPVVFLLHGNSASSLIFRPIFNSPLAQTHVIVALDLPGHGASSNGNEAYGLEKIYIQPGYAQVIIDVLDSALFREDGDRSSVLEVIFLGWSLGGHIGLELIEILSTEQILRIYIPALVIMGTAPIPLGRGDLGFLPSPTGKPHMAMEHLTNEDMDLVARHMVSSGYEPWMRDALERTDGRARKIMFASMSSGDGVSDQKELVEKITRVGHDGAAATPGSDSVAQMTKTTVAVINGAKEQYINIRFIADGVNWGPGLWKGRCFEIPDAAHTAFWEDWEGFWALFKELVDQVDNGVV